MTQTQNRQTLFMRGRSLSTAGMGMLRAALLFGSAAIAMTLLLVPMADRFSRSGEISSGIDYMSTGSIDRSNNYTIRRSVLQDQGAVCIIRADGGRSGRC